METPIDAWQTAILALLHTFIYAPKGGRFAAVVISTARMLSVMILSWTVHDINLHLTFKSLEDLVIKGDFFLPRQELLLQSCGVQGPTTLPWQT